jgi:hypothetical protein
MVESEVQNEFEEGKFGRWTRFLFSLPQPELLLETVLLTPSSSTEESMSVYLHVQLRHLLSSIYIHTPISMIH